MAFDQEDVHVLAELVHANRVFGVKEDDALMKKALDYIIHRQHDDGNWYASDAEEVPDQYTQYHAANVCISALMRPCFRGYGESPKFAFTDVVIVCVKDQQISKFSTKLSNGTNTGQLKAAQ